MPTRRDEFGRRAKEYDSEGRRMIPMAFHNTPWGTEEDSGYAHPREVYESPAGGSTLPRYGSLAQPPELPPIAPPAAPARQSSFLSRGTMRNPPKWKEPNWTNLEEQARMNDYPPPNPEHARVRTNMRLPPRPGSPTPPIEPSHRFMTPSRTTTFAGIPLVTRRQDRDSSNGTVPSEYQYYRGPLTARDESNQMRGNVRTSSLGHANGHQVRFAEPPTAEYRYPPDFGSRQDPVIMRRGAERTERTVTYNTRVVEPQSARPVQRSRSSVNRQPPPGFRGSDNIRLASPSRGLHTSNPPPPPSGGLHRSNAFADRGGPLSRMRRANTDRYP